MLFDEGDQRLGIGATQVKICGEDIEANRARWHLFPTPKGAGKDGGRQDDALPASVTNRRVGASGAVEAEVDPK